jgi:hypothetical protein
VPFSDIRSRSTIRADDCSKRCSGTWRPKEKVATGTIVDATIINAPCSAKNADKARDQEMHQTRKGKQWYFGLKGILVSTAGPSLFMRWWSRQPMSPTARYCLICCMGKTRVG